MKTSILKSSLPSLQVGFKVQRTLFILINYNAFLLIFKYLSTLKLYFLFNANILLSKLFLQHYTHTWVNIVILFLHSSIKNIFFFRSFFPSRSRPPPKDVLNVWFEQTVSTAQTQTADTETTTNLENIFRKKNINHSLSPNTVAHSDIGCSHHLGLNNKYPNPPLLKL